MKLKALLILAIILFSLIPVYVLIGHLQQMIRPRESMKRLMFCMLAVLALIFAYTFSLVFLIKTVFPGA